MRYNFSSMQIEGDDVGDLRQMRRRSRLTDPDRIRFSSGDIVEEHAARKRPSISARPSLRGTGEAEFGMPYEGGTENLDIAPVSNPFTAMSNGNKPMLLSELSEYDQPAWDSFKSNKTKTYEDDAVVCHKDNSNRPACRLISESSASQRRNGEAARMQRAVDAFLNKVPFFQDLGVEVPLSGENRSKIQVLQLVAKISGGGLPDPIGTRAGYDGWVGPSTFGLTMTALAIASDLNPQGYDAAVTDAVNSLTEAGITRYAGSIASFLEDTVANFDKLLSDYIDDPPPSPMLVPTSLPILKKKSWVGPVIVGLACGTFLFAAFGQQKADKLRTARPKAKGKASSFMGI